MGEIKKCPKGYTEEEINERLGNDDLMRDCNSCNYFTYYNGMLICEAMTQTQ